LLDESFEQERPVSVLELPVGGDLPSGANQNGRGQILAFNPRQDEDSNSVHDPGFLRSCNPYQIPEARQFREKRLAKCQDPSGMTFMGGRDREVHTKKPAKHGVQRALHFCCREFTADFLAARRNVNS